MSDRNIKWNIAQIFILLVLALLPVDYWHFNHYSAEYNRMPLSAIETGLVDFILLPSEMAEKIDNYTNKETTKMNSKVINSDIIETMIINIFALLYSNEGHDFSLYKRNTILRRIDRVI